MIAAGISALILVAEIVWLGVSAYRFSTVSKDLKVEQRVLSRLQARDPYPSAENKAVLEDNLDELSYLVGELAAELNRDPAPENMVEPAELSAFIQTQVERFSKRAEREGVELPDTLEAGFSQYASGGAVANPGDVPRLMRQLHSIRALGDVLMESGVASIDKMSRDLFENEGPREALRRRNADRFAKTKKSEGVNSIASEIGPAGLYLVERVGITFRADEEAIWAVLQGIASAPQFMVVQEFSHRSASNILTYSPGLVKSGAETDNETMTFLREGILRGETARSRPERIVAGNELVEVRMMVDVYHFNVEVPDALHR